MATGRTRSLLRCALATATILSAWTVRAKTTSRTSASRT